MAPTSSSDLLHIVMVPWLAFGHLIPFFQLSISLAKSGIKISFISTPKNIQRLPKIPPNLNSLINLVELQLPSVNGLPEGAEATVDISMDQIQYLKIAYDLLSHQFKQFIVEQTLKKPDWIIIDVIPYWTAEIAREFQIPQILFSVFSASALTFIGPEETLTGENQMKHRPSPESLTIPPEWFNFLSSVAFRLDEAEGFFHGFYGENASGVTDSKRYEIILGSVVGVVGRSCREVEEEYLNLPIYKNKSVMPVGLLPPTPPQEKTKHEVFNWLDKHPPSSVVFVGFGSEVKLSKEQIHEIAYGLEISGLPFVWALRKPIWDIDGNEALPLDFEKRVAQRGYVCMGWAPQLEILAHPSISGSLFHSGWGSIIETLQYGHVSVVLPFVIDQGLNARFLVEKGLAVEVERRDDGRYDRDDVANGLRKAMVDEDGEGVRVRSREMKIVFGDFELHDGYISEFVKYLSNKTNSFVAKEDLRLSMGTHLPEPGSNP